MLDVHPAHHAASTWRDFFIHIATIVLGLLIAIALEQTVEYIHHRHQVAETREALEKEKTQNIRRFGLQTKWFRMKTPDLRTNLAILRYLREHPHASQQSWPGKFNWNVSAVPYADAAWKTAQQDGVIEHMPGTEVQLFAEIYTRLSTIRENEIAERYAMEKARGFLLRDPDPSHLTPADLDTAIADMTNVLVLHLRTAGEQERLNRRFPDFAPAPTTDEIHDVLGIHISGDEAVIVKRENQELKDTDTIP